MKQIRCIGLAVALFALASCEAVDPQQPTIDNPADLAGTADPVVAIGNSLTAGFLSGGLVLNGQLQCYANLVANQFLEGISDAAPVIVPGLPPMALSMPLVQDGIGNESGYGLLQVSPTGALTRPPLTANPEDLLLTSALLRPYANLGVPGALTVDLLQRLSAVPPATYPPQVGANPFFDVVLRNSALPFNSGPPVSDVTQNGTQLGQFLQISASVQSSSALALVWIGNNDILGPATAGSAAVSPSAQFGVLLGMIFDEIESTGIPMVAVANLPSVTSTPYFTTIVGILGQSAITPAMLNTDEADVALILLPAQPALFPGGSFDTDYLDDQSDKSLPASQTLTSSELADLEMAVADYNTVISTEASARGWAYVDVHAGLAGLSHDPTDGTLNAVFPLIPGVGQNVNSAFSLDGLHPSEKGYARIANAFIGAINAGFGPVLGAVRGGPMQAIDEGAVQNRIGFELLQAVPAASGLIIDPATALSLAPRTWFQSGPHTSQ